MTKKPTVTTLASGFNSTETLNANFEALRDGFDNTLSLDGSLPNAMEADLDLNGNNIIGAAGLLINGTDYLSDVEAAKVAAEAAKDAALAALDSFDDRYLGAKASDPTLDNDGNALVAGALYYNTTDDVMKVYEGSSWVAAYASLSGALLATSNLSDLTNTTTARTNLGLATVASTGGYSDLTGLPTLGTAAATAATDYATAAQGTLADSAVQNNDSPTFNAVTATSYAGDGSALTGIAAGATGGGNDDIFYENGQNVTTNYTVTNGKNAMSAGPITINSGVTVTVGAGETWTVI